MHAAPHYYVLAAPCVHPFYPLLLNFNVTAHAPDDISYAQVWLLPVDTIL